MNRRPLLRMRFLVLAATVVLTYVVCPFRFGVVWGQSMAPTLADGELLLLDRNYYRHQPMLKDDVIVFRWGGEVMTKRVYGAPGDRITLLKYPLDGTYEIPNDIVVKKLRQVHHRVTGVRLITMTVPPGKCFVTGDNPSVSCDSRQFGLIDVQNVMGKMVSSLRR